MSTHRSTVYNIKGSGEQLYEECKANNYKITHKTVIILPLKYKTVTSLKY